MAAGQQSLTESQHHLGELLGKVADTRARLLFLLDEVFLTCNSVIFRMSFGSCKAIKAKTQNQRSGRLADLHARQ